ncbi:MAG: hypothetical protein M5R42_08210 [Rhodocyclaceae bacterium]|nr:hypothetical protein [Rhodocyclaceae bacterium]
MVQMLLPFHLLVLLLEGAVLTLLKWDPSYLTKIYLPVFRALLRQRGPLLEGGAPAWCNAGSELPAFFDFRWHAAQAEDAAAAWPATAEVMRAEVIQRPPLSTHLTTRRRRG